MPARYYGDGIVRRLKLPEFVKAPGGIPIRARNLEQQFFMDALLDELDPDDHLLREGGDGQDPPVDGLRPLPGCSMNNRATTGCRSPGPVMALGKDIGFLPGTLDEKMRPWLQPYYDALEVLLPSKPPKDPQFAAKKVSGKKHKKHDEQVFGRLRRLGALGGHGHLVPVKPYERLLKSGLVEIEALCFIRGRSIARRFFILDEAQQLTPHEVKTIITRISEGSKIVLIGDPAQIDNPYVDARSNGLVYCHNRMKGQAIAAHVKLTKGERSLLAELAADLL